MSRVPDMVMAGKCFGCLSFEHSSSQLICKCTMEGKVVRQRLQLHSISPCQTKGANSSVLLQALNQWIQFFKMSKYWQCTNLNSSFKFSQSNMSQGRNANQTEKSGHQIQNYYYNKKHDSFKVTDWDINVFTSRCPDVEAWNNWDSVNFLNICFGTD